LRLVREINEIYQSHSALWSQDTIPAGYSWIDANDSANNVLSFLRYGSDGSVMACVFNFAGTEHSRYRLRRGRHRRSVARPPRLSRAGAATHLRAVAPIFVDRLEAPVAAILD
jgi:1,4-alpha-glucan branching enzyme